MEARAHQLSQGGRTRSPRAAKTSCSPAVLAGRTQQLAHSVLAPCSLCARSARSAYGPLATNPRSAPYPACIIHQLTHRHQLSPPLPLCLLAGILGTPVLECTGVYWGNWGALGGAAPPFVPKVEQHRSRPSPVPHGCASILEQNKPRNNPAKQGAPAPPNALATDPQKGRRRAVSHPNVLHLFFSPHICVPRQEGVPPSLLPAPHPRLPGCRISERQSPSCKTTNLFILNINSIKQMYGQAKDRSSSRQAEGTGRSTRQIISSFFKPAGYNE